MELIVAVYEDWGIGKDGTQPIALKADRKFFRETTRGAAVIAGRRTVEDFPDRKPLPGRENILLSAHGGDYPGFTLCGSVEEVLEKTKNAPRAMVIGGGVSIASCFRTATGPMSPGFLQRFPVIPGFPTWRKWRSGGCPRF